MGAGLTLREIAVTSFDNLYAWGSAPVLFLPPAGAAELPFFDTPANTTAEFKSRGVLAVRPSFDPKMIVLPVLKSGRNPFSGTITVGRAGVNDVQIQHPTVSKVHAWFLRPNSESGTWRLVDCDSMNGTTVNGVRVTPAEQALIRPGDVLGFGSIQALFAEPSEAHELLREFCLNFKDDKGEDTARVERPDATSAS